MRRSSLFLLAAASCFAQTPPAPPPVAQPLTQPLIIEPTVITVTGQAMPLSATSASVIVITRQEIANSHADNVGDVLRQVPFLFLMQSGGQGGLTTVTIRGGKPNFTLVMYD